ncbi:hypothetical protein PYW08_014542 [Mythimna loreyi]|uniref:Uncharacterized protein n=1 Tax=Mythimna loreyi TaxID=667449 RepID=A0ACC2R3F8_9NEOP|nr:hypothetical protein PYW08_014542 [Mythimna loreyi]
MCYYLPALVMPIFCTIQTILRLLTTVALAIEDILRLTIQAIHSWITTILHTVGIIPLCCVYCFTQKCLCSQICSTSCSPACYPMRSNCGCILFLTMTLVFIFVYLFTDWWEDVFATLGIELPCFIDKKSQVTNTEEANKNKSEDVIVKLTHKRALSPKMLVRSTNTEKRLTTKSMKHARKATRNMDHEIRNELDVSFIDYFKDINKEKVSKFRSNEKNFTYVTVIVNAILDEPDNETLNTKNKTSV